jgi:hypothetical protein
VRCRHPRGGVSAHAELNAAQILRRAAVPRPDAAPLAGELQAPAFMRGELTLWCDLSGT